MQRRQFIRQSAYVAMGVSVFGNISWNKDHFVGDSPTTSDILGPFYRPGAPIRENINPIGYTGKLFHLEGIVYKTDGSPFENSLVEIWQCDENRLYDNISDEFKYRGAQKTKADGKYHFITTHPIPYQRESDPNLYRPAHFHLRVSGKGQRDLITQIYFKGDPHISSDPPATASQMSNRVVAVGKNRKGEEQLIFNIIMSEPYTDKTFDYEKIVGLYRMDNKSTMEFFRSGDTLFWKWNGQILDGLVHKGNNEFVSGLNNVNAKFDISGREAKLEFYFKHPLTAIETKLQGSRYLRY